MKNKPSLKMPSIDIGRLFKFGKRVSHVIGVDMGTSSLKVTGLRLAQTNSLLFYSIINIPQGSDDTFISEAIKKAVKNNNFPSQDAVLTFSDESIAVRRLELPRMPLREVAEALRWKAKDVVHFDISKAAIGFELLSEAQKEDGSKIMDLIFVAIASDAMERRVRILKNAGLAVISVSVQPFGIQSVLRMAPKSEQAGTILVADAGYSKTEVSIFKNNSLEFVRAIPFGSGGISESLQAKFLSDTGEEKSLSKEEAESVKKSMGIAYEAVMLENGISSRQLLSLMRPILERLSKEIKRSIEYYVHEFGQDSITQAYLAGGGAGLKNMDKYLGEELNMPVTKMSIPGSIDTSKVVLSSEDAMSIVSLVGMTASYRKCMNLLPQEYKAEKIEIIEKMSLRTIALIFVAILWLSFFFTKARTDDYVRRLKSAPLQQSAVSQVKALRERVSEREAFLTYAQSSQIPVEYIMKELSNIIPANVVLENMAVDKKGKILNIKGYFYGPNISAQTVLANFMQDLEKSGFFKEAQLVSLQGAKTDGPPPRPGASSGSDNKERSSFDITCSLE